MTSNQTEDGTFQTGIVALLRCTRFLALQWPVFLYAVLASATQDMSGAIAVYGIDSALLEHCVLTMQ
jgi:hypothetical protein